MNLNTYTEIDFKIDKNIEKIIDENKNYNELQQEIMSSSHLMFNLNNSKSVNINHNFPLDPEIRIQKIGKNINMNDIDINSKLLNLDKPLNRDVTNNLKNIETNNLILDPIIFNVENTYLNNPSFNIKGLNKNRWYNLSKNNPQDNCIEPFKRLGENTVLNQLDDFKTCY
tara:strand:- start:2115 stop:2624 length:510 start_codon:yes stop_codon:yes gene_type:complete